MKVGVIGTGYWGKKHVEEYCNLGHEIVISDLSDDKMKFCKLNYGAQTVNDYHDILNDEEIKTVSICTPNSSHHEIALEALGAGKNILLEKPIATSSKDANEIVQLVENKNLILVVGHIFRFNNAIKKVKEMILTRQLGKIYTVDLSWTNLEPILPDRDILFDLGVHPIDIVDNLFEKTPNEVFCTGKGFRQNNAEFAIINYQVDNPFDGNEIFVNVELSWLNPVRTRRMVIVGSEKTAVVDCVLQKIKLINNKSGISEEVSIVPNNTIRDELEFFLNRSQNMEKIKSPEPSGKVASRIIEIIEKGMRSLKKYN